MNASEILPIFREQFPEFADKTDDQAELFLNNAILVHAICEMATVYLAGHLCVIDKDSGVGTCQGSDVDNGGAAREVVSETAKSITTTFKAMGKDGTTDSFYTASAYGRMYITLRNSCPGRRFSVRVA